MHATWRSVRRCRWSCSSSAPIADSECCRPRAECPARSSCPFWFSLPQWSVKKNNLLVLSFYFRIYIYTHLPWSKQTWDRPTRAPERPTTIVRRPIEWTATAQTDPIASCWPGCPVRRRSSSRISERPCFRTAPSPWSSSASSRWWSSGIGQSADRVGWPPTTICAYLLVTIEMVSSHVGWTRRQKSMHVWWAFCH